MLLQIQDNHNDMDTKTSNLPKDKLIDLLTH